jgi:hypothetical protein
LLHVFVGADKPDHAARQHVPGEADGPSGV